jgi:O-antigen/teichoic acid export membrane protein
LRLGISPVTVMNNQLFNNTLYSALDKLITTIVGFVFISIIVNHIGADKYGVYLILSMFSITGALNIFDLGLEVSIQYYISYYSNNKFRQNIIIVYSVLLYFSLGTFFSFVLYIFSSEIASTIHSKELSIETIEIVLKIVTLNLFFQFIMVSFKAILEGARYFSLTKMLNSGFFIIQSILIIIAVKNNYGLIIIFQIIVLITLFKILILIYWVNKYLKHHYLNIRLISTKNLVLLKKILKYSFEILGTRLVGFVFNQTDKLLIWKFLTPMWMTIYDIVTKPIIPLRMVIQILNTALIPEIANYYKEKKYQEIMKLYVKLVKYTYIIILPLSFILLFYIDVILSIWIDKSYSGYSYLSIIVIFTYLLLPISAISGTIITGLKAVDKILLTMSISAFVNLILSIVFIGQVGISGLLIATLIAEYYLVIPYNKKLEKILDIKSLIYSKFFKLLLFHVPMIMLLVLIKIYLNNNFISIIVAFIFLLIQYVLNYKFLLNAEEKQFLRKKFLRKKD